MRWLAGRFGADRLLRAEVVRPTAEFFPDPYDGTPEAAQRCLLRLCGHLGIQPALRLEVHENDEIGGPGSLYEPGTLHVARAVLDDAVALSAVLAHGLAGHLLLSQKLLTDERDREWVSDLLAVFLGLGILLGNATLRERHHHGGRSSWSSYAKFTYLTTGMLGYATAVFAWLRGEEEPPWICDLSSDTAEALRAGLRYLVRTKDSLFRPDNMRWQPNLLPAGMLLDQLGGASPSQRVALLWEIAERRLAMPEIVAAVAELLGDRQAGIRAEAARALAALAPSAEAVVPELIDFLNDPDGETRSAAAYALGKLGVQAETVVAALAEHLEDDCETAAAAAMMAVARFGRAAAPVLPTVLAALKDALLRNRYPALDLLVHAVRVIAAEPQAEIDALVESCDPDLRQQAPGILAECRPVPATAEGPGAWFGQFFG
jgi:hypothetical protein